MPSRRIRLSGEVIDATELLELVQSGVAWWREKLTTGDRQTREAAARSIAELSQVLDSLSKQIAQGRQTLRITRRLPAARLFPVACPTCGRGNRAEARFCQSCGASMPVASRVIPMATTPRLRYVAAAHSDVGQVRANNQDAWYSGPLGSGFLAMVADGMGGAKAGEVASQLASEQVRTHLAAALAGTLPANDEAWQELLRQAAIEANKVVYQQAHRDRSQQGMGTTLTIALLIADRLYIGQVGDSRAYMLNTGGASGDGAPVAQLTTDHSLVARLVDIGQLTAEEARRDHRKNMLYRSVGTDPHVEVDTFAHRVTAGDVLVLCSDGLTNHVDDTELARIVLGSPTPEVACKQLVRLANERGGRDNITALVVRIEEAR